MNNCSVKKVSVTLFFAVMAALTFMFVIRYAANVSVDEKYSMDFSKGWQLIHDDKVIDDFNLETNMDKKTGDKVIISKRLPENMKNYDALYFTTQSIEIKIYVDNEMIYKYGQDKDFINTTPGDYVHFVTLPRNSEGKKVSIEIDFPYGTPSLMIRKINIVNDKEMMASFINNKSIPFLICFIMGILGVVCMVSESVLFKRIYGNRCLRYLGLFILFVALWSLTQIRLLPLIFGKEIYKSAIAYIMLSFIPVPLAIFAKIRYNLKKSKAIDGIIILTIIVCLLVNVLNILGVWEYAENVVLTQISLVISSFSFVFVTIKYSRNVKNQSSRKIMTFAIAFLAFSGALDIANYYTNRLDDYGYYSRYGLLVFMICVFADIMIYSNNMVTISEASKSNLELALTDGLTGIRNRTAFNHAVNKIVEDKSDKIYVGCVAFDVNGLKRMNDLYGHNKGDTLIIETSGIIERSCTGYGTAYRVGGDEFTIITEANSQKNIEKNISEIISTFNEMLSKANKRLMWQEGISVAYGDSYCNRKESGRFENIFDEADSKMYEMKRKMKEDFESTIVAESIENERNRIAQEMHDTTGHTLTMIQSLINIIESEQIAGNEENITKRLTMIRELAGNGIKELRHSINNIKESSGKKVITESIKELSKKIEEVNIEVCVQGEENDRYQKYSEAFFETFREAITNTLRYSKATHMDVIIKFLDKSLEMYIFDNGEGCDKIIESDGLNGIRKRIEKFGGLVRFSSTIGEGFQIVIKIQLDEQK